jgi:glycosyltransferase involved in cell wall biosynthesis
MNSRLIGAAGLKATVSELHMPTSQLRFTVITPNYNTGRFLAETIESVLRNLQPGDEYFVIDGGSSDDSVDIIRRYESKLHGWVSEPDRGYADAIAKGFRQGSGQLLAWINSSDLLLPGALDYARHLMTNPEVDLIFGDDYHIAEDSTVLFRSYGGASSLRNMMLYGGWTPLQDACFWRRSLYDRVGGINPDTKYAADFEFFLKSSLVGRCLYVPVAFSAYRKHTGQVSISGARRYRDERRAILNQVRERAAPSVAHRITYYLWLRMRSRILQPLWNSRLHRGKRVLELAAEWPMSA